MRNDIDSSDLLILKTFHERPNVSVKEVGEVILIHSPSSILYKLRKLEELGLIDPPPKSKQHRSRNITEKGIALLEQQGMIRKCRLN